MLDFDQIARAGATGACFRSFGLLSLVALTCLMSSATLAKTTFPVSVPPECAELAMREGVGMVINNRYEAAKAKAKLYRLSDRDPLVHQCREAIKRAQNAARNYASPPTAIEQKSDIP
jgi:hypothetical protein